MPEPRASPAPRAAAGLALRIALGFGVFAILLALWLSLGLDALYDRLVERVAARLLDWSHFPVGSASVRPLGVHDQGYGLVLVTAMFFVSTKVAWTARIARYGALLLLLASGQIVALALQLHLAVALEFQRNAGAPLLLPWEIAFERRTFQLLFVLGLQIVPFAGVALTAFWNSDRSLATIFDRDDAAAEPGPGPPRVRAARREPRSRAGWLALVVVAAMLLAGETARRLRERDPRHVQAHRIIAENFYARGEFARATEQYRAATRGGARDGPAWFRLVTLLHCAGEADDSARQLRRALQVVGDPAWRRRLEQGPQTAPCPAADPAATRGPE